jgi:hypothetical protein
MIQQRHKLDYISNIIPNIIDNAISSSCGNLIGIARTAATIVTTKVGTFSSTWWGAGTLYFDPGDGGPVEPLTLITNGVTWNHEYLSAGSKTIKITGDLSGVTVISIDSQNLTYGTKDLHLFGDGIISYLNIRSNGGLIGSVSDLGKFLSITNLRIYGTKITGDLSDFGSTVLSGYFGAQNLTTISCNSTIPIFLPGSDIHLESCGFLSSEVDNFLINASINGMSSCTVHIDGTNQAPSGAQEVTDAIATLAGNGVTLYVST